MNAWTMAQSRRQQGPAWLLAASLALAIRGAGSISGDRWLSARWAG